MEEHSDKYLDEEFYKKAVLKPFTEEDEKKYILFKKLAPMALKLKFKAKDRHKYRARTDLFDNPETSFKGEIPETDEPSPWLDKDFAFQLAYEMEDLKSLKWYEHIVERCDRLRERQILLRARGEVMELKNTSEEPKNKGVYFSRLVRKYSEEREISLAGYGTGFKSDFSLKEKREFIKRKRKGTGQIIKELKKTLSIEELCRYHKLALEALNEECGKFFRDNEIDVPSYVMEGYINKVIAKDYGLNLPDTK